MEIETKYLKYKDRVVFGKQSLPYFKRLPKDYVDNEACFIILNKGELSIRSSEAEIKLHQNTGVLAKCLNYFLEADQKYKNENKPIEVIAIILYPDIVEEIFDFQLSNFNYNLKYNIKQLVLNELLQNFKENINLLLDYPELTDEEMIKSKLKEFIMLITKFENLPSQFEFLAGLFNPAQINFRSVVENNLYNDFTIDDLAKLAHVSVASFKRKFKEVYDESPKKYINRRRMERAALLLANSKLRISDIAFDVGYNSLSTFNRNFTEHFDKSPSDFRLS
jgi:AraC family transcriptional regulator, exoenzyme S synthesis regulatory protein ExsA